MLENPIFSQFRESFIPAWEKVFELLEDENEKSEVIEFAQWIISKEKKKPGVYGALRGVGLTQGEEILKEVSFALVEDFKSDYKKLELFQVFFRQYVIAGKNLKLWSFDIPKIAIIAPREKNPINPTRFNLLPKAKLWRDALHTSIKNSSVNNLSEGSVWGQLILSAIFHGGLINSQLLISFVKSISTSEKYHLSKRYLDLTPTWQGNEEVEYRRWFFDPLTELIAIKYQDVIKNQNLLKVSGKWIASRANEILKQHLPKSELPRGITELLEAAGVRYSIHLPPFLVSYSQRKSLSHSLQLTTWGRLAKEIKQKQEEVDLSQWQKTIEIDDSEEMLSFFVDKKLTEIRDCLKTDRADRAKQNLTAVLINSTSETTGYYYLLTDWLRSLLNKSKNRGAPLKVSTLRGYLSTIGRRLAEELNEQTLDKMSAEEFEDAYSVILDSLESRGLKRKVARIVFQFHQFIADKYQVVAIEYYATLGVSFSPVPVDANLVWVDEYYQILSFLENSNLIEIHPDLAEIAQLLFILGYRCGLRRMEALKLRIVDFQNGHRAHLVIRPHQERRLKTKNSQRLIPLYALLTEEEFHRLERWRIRRVEQEAYSNSSEYLFAIPSKNFDSVPQELVFPILHSAMRSVTGDDKLRYHHLRHSFASLTLLRLMASTYSAPISFFKKMPRQANEIKFSTEFREQLLPVQGPTRKYLYAVGRLLGHSGPDISLEHYIHILDILLYQQMQLAFPASNDLLVSATPLPVSTSYRHLVHGTEELLYRARKRLHLLPDEGSKNKKFKPITESLIAHEDSIELLAWQEVNKVWQVLLLYFKHNLSIQELAERFQLNEKSILKWIKQSELLNIKNSLGQKIDYPSKPTKKADTKLLKPLTQAFSYLKSQNGLLYQEGLLSYRNNFWVSEQQTVFKSKIEAKEYLNFLRNLELDYKNIELTILIGTQDPVKEIHQHYWQTLNSKTKTFVFGVERGKNNMNYGKYGFLRIKVVNETGVATPAYRFVLQLLLIKEGLVLAP